MNPQQTVFVVDDDEAARESLKWLLESVGYPSCCHASSDAFLESYDGTVPGCLVLDVRMPGMSGLELQSRLNERNWCLPVILVTGHGDIPMAVRAMKGGAIDFLQKPYNDQVLLDRIASALEICANRRRAMKDLEQMQKHFATLTAREREVAILVVNGNVNKVIAAKLALSPRTVEAHRANLMTKMQVASVSELVQICMRLDAANEAMN